MIPPHFNGRRASRHRILRQLGHGNLTRVFLATPVRAGSRGELVVLKLMHPELARDDDFRALFLDQAAATLSLRHPNLVRTLEVIADPDACGLTLEFLQGQTLARILERVGRLRLPVDLHLHILSQALAALDHAHRFAGPRHAETGFMHRDVCPSNVFITYDGQVKLLGTGFGNAVRALETRLGRPLLDLKYAAPEVLLGYPSGPSADLFALGVMVWEAVTRQARISSDDPKAIVRRRTSGEEVELESAWPEASEPLIALCARALAVSPRERYPTALAFRTELDAYLSRSAEASDVVLARLPALMEATFGPEREQMQRFLGARLGAVGRAGEALEEADDELTPREDEWSPEANTRVAAAEPERVDAGFRTGLRRARPEPNVRRETGVHAKGLRHSGAQARPAGQEHPSPLAKASEPAVFGPGRYAPAVFDPATFGPSTIEPGAPAMQPASTTEPPPQETTTAGHRAFSATLDVDARARRGAFRLSPDMLGAVALLLGSLVAVYSIYRHSQRDKRPESQRLAIQAEAHARPAVAPLSSGSGAPATSLPPAASIVAIPALIRQGASAADAGAPTEEPPQTPAFFDGRSPAPPDTAPALRADELPTVDPELRSLQDAIVLAAKAHRFGLERRRARKPETAPHASRALPALPRPIDEADPYSEGNTP